MRKKLFLEKRKRFHHIGALALLIMLGGGASVSQAGDLSLDDSYKTSMDASLISSKDDDDDTYSSAEDAIDLAYEALSSAIDSLTLAYEAAGDGETVADLGWTGTYGCNNYYVNSDSDKVYEYADYSVHWADGITPTDMKSITISASSVSGLNATGDWSTTAECSLKSLSFDNY